MLSSALSLLFAWSLFGKPEAPAPAPTVDTAKIVQAAVDKAVKEAAERIAKETADLQAAEAEVGAAPARRARPRNAASC